MDRRHFLTTELAGLAAAAWAATVWKTSTASARPPGDPETGIAAGTAPEAARSEPQQVDRALPPIIDTHTHFYDPTRPEGVPWPSPNNPLLYRPVLPGEFRRLAEPLGVVGTVVVEASPWVEDNAWLLKLADAEPFLVGVVGRLDTRSVEFEAQLTRFARHPRYRGIRISANELREGLTGKLVERCRLIVEQRLELDVNGGPDTPAAVAQLAERVPELRIVINHAANQRIDGMAPPAAYREAMRAAARFPLVYCKVSALVEQTSQRPAPQNVDFYRPMLDLLWNCFGEDRLLYGSNWPVSLSAAPYATVLDIVRTYFQTKPPAAEAKFFRDNALTAYAR